MKIPAKAIKSLTPAEAYLEVEKRAHAHLMSISGYCKSRGVSRFYIAKWKGKDSGTIPLNKAVQLGIFET